MSKDLLSDHAAHMAILRAVRSLAQAIGATFGPRGGNILLESKGNACPRVTRDGAVVARSIELEDPAENLIVRVICEAAEQSALETRDGTTTTILLAAGAIQAGIKWAAAGHDPGALARSIRRASNRMQEFLRSMSRCTREPREVERIATMASGGDDRLGVLLARALLEVGWDGDVRHDPEADSETDLQIVNGFRLPVNQIESELFPFAGTELHDARLLLHDGKLELDGSMDQFIEPTRSLEGSLVILARDVGEGVASRLLAMRLDGPPVLLARVDAGEELLPQLWDDLALFTGASVRIGDAGQGWPVNLADLGSARSVRVGRSELRVIDGRGDANAFRTRLDTHRDELKGADTRARRALFVRTGRLSGRSAVLRLNAATEPGRHELASRAESALCTTRAALEQGVLPGGGIALLRAAQETVRAQPEDIGAQLLLDAVEALISRLASNAGAEGRAVLEAVRSARGPVGFHALTGKIEDLEAAGVLDPLKVIRSALDNAVSVACALLETGGLLIERPSSSAVREPQGRQATS